MIKRWNECRRSFLKKEITWLLFDTTVVHITTRTKHKKLGDLYSRSESPLTMHGIFLTLIRHCIQACAKPRIYSACQACRLVCTQISMVHLALTCLNQYFTQQYTVHTKIISLLIWYDFVDNWPQLSAIFLWHWLNLLSWLHVGMEVGRQSLL